MYRNTMTRYLRRKGKEITVELVKCCQFCCKPKMLNELFDNIFYLFNHTDKIKIEEKYPTSDFLYTNLWGYMYDKDEDYNKCIEWLGEEIAKSFTENGLAMEKDYIDPEYTEEVMDVCYNYFTWLSSKLGEDTVVERREVIDTLKKILEIFERD